MWSFAYFLQTNITGNLLQVIIMFRTVLYFWLLPTFQKRTVMHLKFHFFPHLHPATFSLQGFSQCQGCFLGSQVLPSIPRKHILYLCSTPSLWSSDCTHLKNTGQKTYIHKKLFTYCVLSRHNMIQMFTGGCTYCWLHLSSTAPYVQCCADNSNQ